MYTYADGSDVVSDDPRLMTRLNLRHFLQLLACEGVDQLDHYIAPGTLTAEEMANDFSTFFTMAASCYVLSAAESDALQTLDDYLTGMSGDAFPEFWNDEALLLDARWALVRHLARQALAVFGWPNEIPPRERRAYRVE